HGTVDETDHAVVSQEQVICHITDGGSAAGVPADGEKQLVLTGGDPGLDGVLFAPAEKASQAVAKGEQVLVVGVRQTTRHVVLRYLNHSCHSAPSAVSPLRPGRPRRFGRRRSGLCPYPPH